ncbi:MAG TPA: 50S ribosomal protein L23 [Candidatus Nanoarchaeia archaeon]|nr:50S ribosomal protein L23 [Candidatus Nanoarchaeia archaeon]
MSYYTLIRHPISTEKSVRLMEKDNKLVFKVARKSSKEELKQAIEEHLKVKIIQLNTVITSKGGKKAYVKLSKATPAIDVATQLGLM